MLSRIKNTVTMGVLLGLLVPLIACALVWLLIHQVPALRHADLLYIAGVGLNAFSMQYFFNRGKEQIARGILAATFLCAFIFFGYKVGWF